MPRGKLSPRSMATKPPPCLNMILLAKEWLEVWPKLVPSKVSPSIKTATHPWCPLVINRENIMATVFV